MQIVIDGYNLLFGANPAANILKDDREDLIQILVKMLTNAKMEATIVFDSYMQESAETKGHLGPLEMIFTNKGQLADELILKTIKASTKPHHILVVTSDKQLAERAKRLLAKVISTKEWFSQIKKQAAKKVKEAKTPVAPLSKIPEEIPKKVPVRSQNPENDLSFYQDIFETRYEIEKEEIKPIMNNEPLKKKRIKKPPKEDLLISEEERWLKLFEKRLKNE